MKVNTKASDYVFFTPKTKHHKPTLCKVLEIVKNPYTWINLKIICQRNMVVDEYGDLRLSGQIITPDGTQDQIVLKTLTFTTGALSRLTKLNGEPVVV